MDQAASDHAGRKPPVRSNDAFRADEIEGTLDARFRVCVARYVDHPAVIGPDVSWSYRQLDQATDRVAEIVRRWCGDQPAAVALLFDLEPHAIAALLGVLRAGKWYVPIDPTTPPARIAAVTGDAQATLLLTDTPNLALACGLVHESVRVIDTTAASDIQREPGADRPPGGPDDLAYVIYTSGSTGQPKGVVQNHRNVVFDIRRQATDLGTTTDDRFGLMFPIAFSASICHIFGALLNGAAVCLFDLKARGLNGLARWLVDQRISIFDINVTTFRSLASILPPDQRFAHVRMVAPGSEPVSRLDFVDYPALLKAWSGEFGGRDGDAAYRRFVSQGVNEPSRHTTFLRRIEYPGKPEGSRQPGPARVHSRRERVVRRMSVRGKSLRRRLCQSVRALPKSPAFPRKVACLVFGADWKRYFSVTVPGPRARVGLPSHGSRLLRIASITEPIGPA